MNKTLDQKLAAIHQDPSACRDFILADAKDADMGFGATAPGPKRGAGAEGFKTLADYREQIRQIVRQGLVDIMLLSASNLEQLAMRENIFANSRITPAARLNDSSDVWVVRGGRHVKQPSRPFRSASLDHVRYGRWSESFSAAPTGSDLGLYSITLNNDTEADLRTLEAYREFRLEAERKQMRHFLEVFAPNVKSSGLRPGSVGPFLNDHIVRLLAGVTSAGRPLFLKMPYLGPAALEELAAYDPHLIVGILGGSAGTTLDAFQLLHDVRRHGARVALFGRKINLSEDPLSFVECLRGIADGQLEPREGVKRYHGLLQKKGLRPDRALAADLKTTPALHRYG